MQILRNINALLNKLPAIPDNTAKAAKDYNIPRGTLQRHIKKAENGQGVSK